MFLSFLSYNLFKNFIPDRYTYVCIHTCLANQKLHKINFNIVEKFLNSNDINQTLSIAYIGALLYHNNRFSLLPNLISSTIKALDLFNEDMTDFFQCKAMTSVGNR